MPFTGYFTRRWTEEYWPKNKQRKVSVQLDDVTLPLCTSNTHLELGLTISLWFRLVRQGPGLVQIVDGIFHDIFVVVVVYHLVFVHSG